MRTIIAMIGVLLMAGCGNAGGGLDGYINVTEYTTTGGVPCVIAKSARSVSVACNWED